MDARVITPADLATYQPPDPSASSFTTPAGRVYTMTETLYPKRYKVFQKRQIEFGYNNTFKGFCEELDKAWAAGNAKQDALAWQTLGNLRDQATYVGGGDRIAALELCALFFNAEGENYLVYNHAEMLAKIEDFETCGISTDFFFLQAARLVPGFYKRFMLSSLSPPADEFSEPQPSEKLP